MSATLLDSLIDPFTECLTVEAARKLVAVRADDALQSRVDELAEKANRGALDDAERADYDRILAAFHLASVVQAKARRMLSA